MPPELELDVEDMDLDTDLDQGVVDDAGASKEAEKPAIADPSTAEDVSNTVADDDTLSVVRDVVNKATSEEAAASSAKGEEVDGLKAGDQDLKKEPDNDGYSDVPFNKHPRFQEVLGKLKASETDATRYRNVQNFIDAQGLEAEEAAEMLVIGGLMKTNPAEAWKRMKPTVQAVLRAAGEVLTDDLTEMVEAGHMTHEAALEVSRARAGVASVNVQRTFAQQQADRRAAEEAANGEAAKVAARIDSASSWETERREKDPNFDSKLPAIIDEVKRLQSLGYNPTSEDGVRDQLNRAYRAVNAKLQPRTVQPGPKPAIRPVTGGQVNGAARSAPTGTLGIIEAVVAQRGAR